MDEVMIASWNERVTPDDHVWHLGDFAWRQHAAYRARLNGKIHLVRGNHDKFSKTVAGCFDSVHDMFCGRLSGDPSTPTFFLFHYPLVSWQKKAHGCIHLYGHVHGRYTRPGELSLDVGVDVHNFRPLLLSEAIELANINAKKLL